MLTRRTAIAGFAAFASTAAAGADAPGDGPDVVLDDFHDAASKADFDRYFGHLTEDSIFLGTDATERWTKSEFQAYARPHFSKGTGWTYVKVERHTSMSRDCTYLWFDELLKNEKYGICRGSGVMVCAEGKWRIAQYNLSKPIPNEKFDAVAAMIEKK